MNLTERYIHEVTRRLPAMQRTDVAKELRATIEEMIADNGSEVEALTALGNPATLALGYSESKQYLIGPDWFQTYLQTLKRVSLYAAPIAIAVLLTIEVVQGAGSALLYSIDALVSFIVRTVGSLVQVAIQVFFWTTAVFVILERTGSNPKEMNQEAHLPWTPDQLPELPPVRQISISESIGAIVWGLFSSAVVVYVFLNLEKVWALNPQLPSMWILTLFALAVASVILGIWKLRVGNWTRALTVFNVMLSIAALGYVLAAVTSKEILNPELVDILMRRGVEGTSSEIREWVSWTAGITVVSAIGIYLWDIANSVVQSIRYSKTNGK